MASLRPKLPRIHDEPAFVLHQHDWSESSLILDVFSRRHGRLALIAKGVKRPTSQYRAVLLPLQPLRLGWGGDAEVRTLKGAQWQGGHVMPAGDALLAGYYLNELLLKLLARDDAHPALFDHYADAVCALAEGQESQAAVVRAFELLLLREIGLLPALDQESASLAPLEPEAHYQLEPDSGLRLVPADEHGLPRDAHALRGEHWLALQRAFDDGQPFAALLQACAGARGNALRQPLRRLLHYHSGVRVFQTRQLVLDVQRLRPPRT
ncbi:MAG: repair protein RecO [Pseudomonadota bacterium]|jgi:DNA repair protein RecO (recombination protein O)